MNRNTVYINRDNKVTIQLINNSIPITDYSGITRVMLDLGSYIIDSDVTTNIIDWSSNTDISIDIGNAGIPVNNYTAKVIVYDVTNTKGIVWSDSLIITVNN